MDSDLRKPPESLTIILLVGFYLAMSTRGLTITSVGSGVTITGTYLFIPLFFLVILWHSLASNFISFLRPSLIGLVLFAGFTLLTALQGIRGPQPLRGTTLVGIVGFGLITYLFTVLTLQTSNAVSRLNYYIYLVGASLSTIGVTGYILIVAFDTTFTEAIGSGFSNWQLIAMPANAILYRYTGFVGDPNFAPWYASLALLCGFVSADGWKRVGLAPIIIAILLSMSRTFIGVMIVAIAGIFVLTRLSTKDTLIDRRIGSMIGWIVFFINGVILTGLTVSASTTKAWIHRRLFAALSNDDRFTQTWPMLLGDALNRPVLGYGSRGVEAKLGQTAHNGFIGLFHDFGLIGLLVWSSLLVYGVRTSLGLVSNGREAALPWLFGLLTVLGMTVMNSFQFDLFNWLILGVALSPGLLRGHDEPFDEQVSSVNSNELTLGNDEVSSPSTAN